MYEMLFEDSSMTTTVLLRQTWIAATKVAETKLAKVGLTPEKLAVLWACRDVPPPLTPAEIARLLFRENQTIAGLLNRMEKEGLIKRVPKRKGQPYTEIKLTSRGEELCGPGIEVTKAIVQRLTAHLSDGEREQFDKTLRGIRDRTFDQLYLEITTPPNNGAGEPIKLNW